MHVTQTAVYTRAPSLMAEGWTDVHASSSTPPPSIQSPTRSPSGSVCARVCECVWFLFNWGSKKSVETGFLKATFTRIPQ